MSSTSPSPPRSPTVGSPMVALGRKKLDSSTGSGATSPTLELEAEPAEPEVESVNLLIRPVDYGWVMGDDLELRVPLDSTVPDVLDMVSAQRGIPLERIFLRMPDGQYLQKKKEKWTLRRNLLTNGSVLQVEPTMRGGWLWNPKQWYIDKLLAGIGAQLDAAVGRPTEDNCLTVTDLGKLGLTVPPPLGDISLRAFIRSYPELFHTHLDVTSCECWVRRAKELYTVPTTGFYPPLLGTVKHFKERRFRWEAYEEIDDRKRVELDFEIPDVSYNLEVLRCNDLKRADVFGSSDPVGVVYWFDCLKWHEVGRTAQRRNTLNPEWRDARFVVSVNASFEVENCKLVVEFFDVDAGDPGEPDEIGDYLGCCVITGRALQRLAADGRTSIQTFPLGQRPNMVPKGAAAAAAAAKEEDKGASKGEGEGQGQGEGQGEGQVEQGPLPGSGEAPSVEAADGGVGEDKAGALALASDGDEPGENQSGQDLDAPADDAQPKAPRRQSVRHRKDPLVEKAPDLPEFLGDPDEDSSDVKGTVTLKGGKAGFEINLQAARDIMPLPFPSSKPFACVYWCGDELGETIPDSRNLRDPQWDETFCIPTLGASTKLEECELEIQVWATQGKAKTIEEEEDPSYNPDLRHTFLGGYIFTGEELTFLFTSSIPYACSMRKMLKQSRNVPIKQRKKPVGGVLCVLGGLSGLAVQPGKILEFSVVLADRIAKLFKVWFSVDWNYVTAFKSPHARVVNMQAEFGQRFRLETSAGASNCLDSHLRIDFWESTEGSIGALDPAYLGMIVVQGQELSDLADQPFAQIKKFVLVLNPSLEPRKQRMIRGFMNIRGGGVMCRCEDERVLIIYAARKLARANFGGFGSSDPFVEVHWITKEQHPKNKNELVSAHKLIGRTETIENTLQPVWDETKTTFFIPIPAIREYSERELKKFIKDNEKLEKEGKPPRDRSMYDEMEMQVAIYDEKGEGEKGLCLGVVRFGVQELLDFFESYEPVEAWYPLVKGKDPKDPATKNASIGSGAEIKIGTTGHRYNSPEARRLEKEAELAAAAAAAAAAKAEAEALEFSRLERELEAKQEEEAAEKARLEEEQKKKEADARAAEAETERIFKEKMAAKKAAEAAAAGGGGEA